MSTLTTLIDLFFKGGVFMIPLAALGLVGLALSIERWLFLRQNRFDGDQLHYELRDAFNNNDIDRAVVLTARMPGVAGRVLSEGLVKVQGGERDILAATERILHSEMRGMEKSRGWLLTVAQVAPLLGIVGTVYGMIIAFMAIEQSASTDPKLLAGGIYQALVTTLAGLLIAIVVTVYQEHVRKESNRILHYLDLFLIETRDWLRGRKETGHGA